MRLIFLKIIEGDGVKINMNKKSQISVIIRCKNEERWIGHAIQSILDKIQKPEIIIIDNFSNDESLNIARSFKHDPLLEQKNNTNYTDIKIFKINNYTPGKSLNYAVKKAKNENILIMSAHCTLNKINIEKHIKDIKKYVCIFGNQNPIFKGKKITKRYIWSHFKNKEMINMFSTSENRFFLHNALCFYKKKILKKYPFDENLQGKEDRYWINNLMKNKKTKFLYDPSLEADHHYTLHGNTWKGIG